MPNAKNIPRLKKVEETAQDHESNIFSADVHQLGTTFINVVHVQICCLNLFYLL